MKKALAEIGTLLLIAGIIVVGYFLFKPSEQEFYHNILLRIVAINSEYKLTNDKFHQPWRPCNIILFETLIDHPKEYIQLDTCQLPLGIH